MEHKKRIPVLRFPEFSCDWKNKKLGDFLSFKNGINGSVVKMNMPINMPHEIRSN